MSKGKVTTYWWVCDRGSDPSEDAPNCAESIEVQIGDPGIRTFQDAEGHFREKGWKSFLNGDRHVCSQCMERIEEATQQYEQTFGVRYAR